MFYVYAGGFRYSQLQKGQGRAVLYVVGAAMKSMKHVPKMFVVDVIIAQEIMEWWF